MTNDYNNGIKIDSNGTTAVLTAEDPICLTISGRIKSSVAKDEKATTHFYLRCSKDRKYYIEVRNLNRKDSKYEDYLVFPSDWLEFYEFLLDVKEEYVGASYIVGDAQDSLALTFPSPDAIKVVCNGDWITHAIIPL